MKLSDYEGLSYGVLFEGARHWECGCITLQDGADFMVVEVCNLHDEEDIGSVRTS